MPKNKSLSLESRLQSFQGVLQEAQHSNSRGHWREVKRALEERGLLERMETAVQQGGLPQVLEEAIYLWHSIPRHYPDDKIARVLVHYIRQAEQTHYWGQQGEVTVLPWSDSDGRLLPVIYNEDWEALKF